MKYCTYTFEECRDIILQCSSCTELQKRAFSVYRKAFGKWPELQQYFSWQRRPRYTPEQKHQKAAEQEQRRRERQARRFRRVEEYRKNHRTREEYDAMRAKQKEERAAEYRKNHMTRAEYEAMLVIKKAEREAKIAVERERKQCIKVQKQLAYIDGKGHLAPTCRVKWTEERVRDVCIECGSTKELRKKYRRAFNLLYQRYPHLLQLFPHHQKSGHLADYKKEWTRDRCREMCKPYKSIQELRDKNSELFYFIRRHGWERYCHQDITGKTYKEKSTDTMCYQYIRQLIMQYETLEDFAVNHPDQYKHAMRTKTLRQSIESHFPAVERRRKHDRESIRIWQESQWGYRTMREGGDISRVIYACEFPDHCAYVGLTADPAKRCREHGWISSIGNSAVAEHKWTTSQDFDFKVLTDFLPEVEARQAEGEWERKYAEEGWTMLNVAPTGSLGGSGVAGVRYWDD